MAVLRLHLHIHRINRRALAQALPLHLDGPVGLAQQHLLKVGAMGAVHADAFAPGDKATNRVGRGWAAAARQLGHQGVNAHHQHATGAGAGAFAVDLVAQPIVGGGQGFNRAQKRLDGAQRKLVFAHRLKQVFGTGKAQVAGQVLMPGGGFALALEQLFHRLAAPCHGFLGHLGVEPSAHLGPRPGAGQKAQFRVEPVAGGATLFGGDDLHRLAVVQRCAQGHHLPIYPHATAAVAQIGVHGVSKIHPRGTHGQLDHRRVRREHINAVVLHRRCTWVGFARAGHLTFPGQQLAHQGNLVAGGFGCGHTGVAFAAGFFVGPMRGHAQLGMGMHGLGADLHLDGPALRIAHHRVQRLVAIAFGAGDVVVKLLDQGGEMAVHPAQRGVAIGHAVDHHPHRADVKHLGKRQRFAAHFFDDAVDVFGPTVHLGLDVLGFQVGLQALHPFGHESLALDAFFVQHGRHLAVGAGLQEPKGQIFQLPLELPNAQTVGQGGKHLQGFLRQVWRHSDFVGRHVAQGLQPRGQAQQHHAQIARKRQQHLAHVFARHGAVGAGFGTRSAHAPARLALHMQQLVGFDGQAGQARAKGLAQHLGRFAQMVAGIDQIASGLHGGRAPNARQDVGHLLGVVPMVFTAIEGFPHQQGLGQSTGALEQALALIGRRIDQRQHRRDLRCGQLRISHGGFLVHVPAHVSVDVPLVNKKEATAAT